MFEQSKFLSNKNYQRVLGRFRRKNNLEIKIIQRINKSKQGTTQENEQKSGTVRDTQLRRMSKRAKQWDTFCFSYHCHYTVSHQTFMLRATLGYSLSFPLFKPIFSYSSYKTLRFALDGLVSNYLSIPSSSSVHPQQASCHTQHAVWQLPCHHGKEPIP